MADAVYIMDGFRCWLRRRSLGDDMPAGVAGGV
jgi:hypothetical protein